MSQGSTYSRVSRKMGWFGSDVMVWGGIYSFILGVCMRRDVKWSEKKRAHCKTVWNSQSNIVAVGGVRRKGIEYTISQIECP